MPQYIARGEAAYCLAIVDRISETMFLKHTSWPVPERRTEDPCLRGVIPEVLGNHRHNLFRPSLGSIRLDYHDHIQLPGLSISTAGRRRIPQSDHFSPRLTDRHNGLVGLTPHHKLLECAWVAVVLLESYRRVKKPFGPGIASMVEDFEVGPQVLGLKLMPNGTSSRTGPLK